MRALWLLAQQSPSVTDGLGPFAAFAVLATSVIGGLAKAFASQRQENKELNNRVFLVVEKVEPLLYEVAGALKESTRAVEQASRGRDQ